MFKRKSILGLFIVSSGFFVITSDCAFSQPSESESETPSMGQGQIGMPMGRGGPGGNQEPGLGQMQRDPGQMQRMMDKRLKELLECGDEEWTVIEPKVLKVLTLSSQSRGFNMGMIFRRSNNQGNTPANRMDRPFRNQGDESLTALQELLENKEATASQIKEQVDEVRKAREKSEQELAMARKELRELLTVRQEAILISIGLLN